jgi:hypothetical protein
VTIQFVRDSAGGGSGETNTASNKGTGADSLFYQKSGVDLQFRRLKDSTGVIITPSGDTALSFNFDPAYEVPLATFADSARAIDTAFAALKTRMLNLMGPFIDTTQLDTIKNAHHAVTADTATTALADANGASITAQYLPRVTFKDSLAASVDPHIGEFIDTTTLDTIQNAHKAVFADSATNIADGAVDATDKIADNAVENADINWPSTPFDVTEWFTNLYPTATDSVTVTHPVYRADSMFSFGAWTTKASDVVATIVGRFRLPAWAAAVDSVTITARRVGTAEVDSLVYFTAANVQAQPLTREAVSAGPYTSGVTVLTPTITGAGAGEWMSIRAYLDLDATGDSTMASVTVWLND